jgi:hypothetical protein
LVFFDDNADSFADRVAIVTAVYEEEIDVILGGTGAEVHEETFPRYEERIAGYLALPTNPDYETLEDPENPDCETLEDPENSDCETLEDPENPDCETLEDPENPDCVTLEASETEADPEADPAEAGTDTLLDPCAELGAAQSDGGTRALVDPYAPVLLTAETEKGVTATLSALAAAFPYPVEELTLTVREVGADDPEFASGIRALNDSIAEEGGKVLGARYLDISVWHAETAEPESSDAEAAGVADIEAQPADEFLPADPEADPEEQVLFGEAPAVETKLVEIRPEGAVEITVEGLWGEGTVKVFRIGEDSTAQELSVSPDPVTDRITVTTGLN